MIYLALSKRERNHPHRNQRVLYHIERNASFDPNFGQRWIPRIVTERQRQARRMTRARAVTTEPAKPRPPVVKRVRSKRCPTERGDGLCIVDAPVLLGLRASCGWVPVRNSGQARDRRAVSALDAANVRIIDPLERRRPAHVTELQEWIGNASARIVHPHSVPA